MKTAEIKVHTVVLTEAELTTLIDARIPRPPPRGDVRAARGGVVSTVSRSIGTGAVGHGGEPTPWRTRPDRCAQHGHPGVTYSPWHDVTACLCGKRWQEGDQVVWPKADGIDGPLREYRGPDGEFEPIHPSP